MKASIRLSVLGTALCLAASALAQAPADAPAGTNGLCKDGTYSQSAQKKGACRGHKGVQEWYASTSADSTAAPAAAPSAATPAPAPAKAAPAAAAPVAKTTSSSGSGAFAPAANAAPGGGPGLVWVNSSTNVYHCPGDQWYGKTKHGEYMSEADAKAKSNRPDHGKACQ
jgi:Protein of unknown function (DUF3761)